MKTRAIAVFFLFSAMSSFALATAKSAHLRTPCHELANTPSLEPAELMPVLVLPDGQVIVRGNGFAVHLDGKTRVVASEFPNLLPTPWSEGQPSPVRPSILFHLQGEDVSVYEKPEFYVDPANIIQNKFHQTFFGRHADLTLDLQMQSVQYLEHKGSQALLASAGVESPLFLGYSRDYESYTLALTLVKSATTALLNATKTQLTAFEPSVKKETLPRRKLRLSNYGLYRFIAFIPRGTNFYAVGRILDIDTVKFRGKSPTASVFVEWISPFSFESTGVRNFQQLNPEEIHTLKDLSEADRIRIENIFRENMNFAERRTEQLSRELGLHPVRYGPESAFNRNVNPALIAESLFHEIVFGAEHGTASAIRREFGDISDLYAPKEIERKFANTLDVMSRQSPRYIMNRFFHPDWIYIFEILADDGSLLVAPLGPRGTHMPANFYRLGMGRPVYILGFFQFNSRGQVEVLLRNEGHLAGFGSLGHDVLGIDRSEFANMEEFIWKTFAMQAGRFVFEIQGRPVNADEYTRFMHTYTNQASGTEREQEASAGKKLATNYTVQDGILKGIHLVMSMPSYPRYKFDWKVQLQKRKTLTFYNLEKWQKLPEVRKFLALNKNMSTEFVAILWTFYVFSLDPEMAPSVMRKTSRKLLSASHSDHGAGSAPFAGISNDIGMAFAFLKKHDLF